MKYIHLIKIKYGVLILETCNEQANTMRSQIFTMLRLLMHLVRLMHFKRFFDESSPKPNKIWVDQGSKFYYRSLKSWLHGNGIEMYSTHICCCRKIYQRKKIYDHRILVSTNAYNDKLHGIVDKYNNTCDRTIKIKPSDVKPSNYIDYGVEHNDN